MSHSEPLSDQDQRRVDRAKRFEKEKQHGPPPISASRSSAPPKNEVEKHPLKSSFSPVNTGKSRWEDDEDEPMEVEKEKRSKSTKIRKEDENPEPPKPQPEPVVLEKVETEVVTIVVEEQPQPAELPSSPDRKRKLEVIELEEPKQPDVKRQKSILVEPLVQREAVSFGLQSCRSVSNYDRVCALGQGSFGVVFKARCRKTKELVALKQVKMKNEKEGFPVTSIREIRILMQCRHVNIVNAREVVVGKSVDDVYIVMEYIEHDLKELLEDMSKPFSTAEVKCLLHQLLLGMEYLHDNWIIHRDIKTSNLLYNNHGILKIADFGSARPYGHPVKPYTRVVVTLWYRAPELLLGATTYTIPIDMWAVGCVFGEILLGKALLQGMNETNQLDKMFKLLGSVDRSIWPDFHKLPDAKHFNFTKKMPNDLRSIFPTQRLSPLGLDLLTKLLTYDPEKRMTANAALRHDWWEESPLMKDTDMMPTWPSRTEDKQ